MPDQSYKAGLVSISATYSNLAVMPLSGIEPVEPERPMKTGAILEGVSPYAGYEAWISSGSDVGDAGGGIVSGDFVIPADNRYYTVTAIYGLRIDTGIDAEGYTVVPPQTFDAFKEEALATDVQQIIAAADDGVNTIIKKTDFQTVYLGRAKAAAGNTFRIRWRTNTNTVVYDFMIAGLRSFRPGMPWYNALQQGRVMI